MPRSKGISTELSKEWRLIPGRPLPYPTTPQTESHHIRSRRRDRDRLCRNLRYCWGVCRNGLRISSPLPACGESVGVLRTPFLKLKNADPKDRLCERSE